MSTLAQVGLSGPSRDRTYRRVPALPQQAGGTPSEGEACRRRKRQPAGSGRRPSRTYAPRTWGELRKITGAFRGNQSSREASPPASRHFSPPCLPVNQPACASRAEVRG
ncbi:hypothetical protein SNL152K_7497 [Streptomyces sp. NL15-2K]|nr:hypothetical protein SNL152K_7497 [Streptomyces sp. NL15-2K]